MVLQRPLTIQRRIEKLKAERGEDYSDDAEDVQELRNEMGELRSTLRKDCEVITDRIKEWTKNIENQGSLQQLSEPNEKQLAWNLYELLDK